jgi:protein-disulfide isomerase
MKTVLMMTFATLLASAADHPVEGNPKSPVRVVAYGSLQCPDCTTYRHMLDEQLLRSYGDRVAFEHRDFPLEKHKWARQAAIAGRYFDTVQPALGIEFRRWAMNNIANITPEAFNDKLRDWAKLHGADPTKAVAALNDAALARLVEEDYQEGIARGVARTPTVFVNGEPFIEHFTVEEISKGIDTALAATSKK